MRFSIISLKLVLLLWSATLKASAGAEMPAAFKAEYEGRYKGLPVRAKGLRSLEQLAPGLDYLLIRLRQNNDGREFELNIRSVQQL